MAQMDNVVSSIAKEIEMQKDYLQSPIETVYFGGGTPSLLSEKHLGIIWEAIDKNFSIENLTECTLEANPDDVNPAYLKLLQKFPFNRLSMGIQSFFEADLQFMHRAHNAQEAERAVGLAQDAGFENLTIDLIYGTPGLSNENWEKNLAKAVELGVPHISSYALTVEERTKLAHDIAVGKAAEPKSEQAARQFEILVQQLTAAGYEHYEISNFARAGHYAVHNTNYWSGKHYLGVGPSAHSFNGTSRQWNIANNALYQKSLEKNTLNFEREELNVTNQMNERLLTGLRTMWGVNLVQFEEDFGFENLTILLESLNATEAGFYDLSSERLVLTEKGKLFADGIASGMFF